MGKRGVHYSFINEGEPPETIDYLIKALSGGSSGTNVRLTEEQMVTGRKESNGAKTSENEKIEATRN